MDKPKKVFYAEFAREIDGEHTQFVFHPFGNKWFVLITQFGKITNMYDVEFSKPRNKTGYLPIRGATADLKFYSPVDVSVTCKFGADHGETEAAIKMLMNTTKLSLCPTALLVSLGLKKAGVPSLREIGKVVDDMLKLF